jgi:hypothetical protein
LHGEEHPDAAIMVQLKGEAEVMAAKSCSSTRDKIESSELFSPPEALSAIPLGIQPSNDRPFGKVTLTLVIGISLF